MGPPVRIRPSAPLSLARSYEGAMENEEQVDEDIEDDESEDDLEDDELDDDSEQ